MRRAGNENGILEARNAVAAIGKVMTKHQAHTWLNRAVAAGIVGKNADDAETWEWGCRIMFMLEIVTRLSIDAILRASWPAR
jgi:hypothetical protein